MHIDYSFDMIIEAPRAKSPRNLEYQSDKLSSLRAEIRRSGNHSPFKLLSIRGLTAHGFPRRRNKIDETQKS